MIGRPIEVSRGLRQEPEQTVDRRDRPDHRASLAQKIRIMLLGSRSVALLHGQQGQAGFGIRSEKRVDGPFPASRFGRCRR
jgi:hypothetical protein